MIHAGYVIVTEAGEPVRTFGSLPSYIAWPNGDRSEPATLMAHAGWRFVERWTDFPAETRTRKIGGESAAMSGDRLVVTAPLIDRAVEEIAQWDAERIPAPVPALRFRLALLEAGILDAVEAYVTNAPREVRLAWEFHGEVEFDNPWVAAAATGLGVDDAGLRALFARAAQMDPGR